jgi:hypothetical protein
MATPHREDEAPQEAKTGCQTARHLRQKSERVRVMAAQRQQEAEARVQHLQQRWHRAEQRFLEVLAHWPRPTVHQEAAWTAAPPWTVPTHTVSAGALPHFCACGAPTWGTGGKPSTDTTAATQPLSSVSR